MKKHYILLVMLCGVVCLDVNANFLGDLKHAIHKAKHAYHHATHSAEKETKKIEKSKTGREASKGAKQLGKDAKKLGKYVSKLSKQAKEDEKNFMALGGKIHHAGEQLAASPKLLHDHLAVLNQLPSKLDQARVKLEGLIKEVVKDTAKIKAQRAKFHKEHESGVYKYNQRKINNIEKSLKSAQDGLESLAQVNSAGKCVKGALCGFLGAINTTVKELDKILGEIKSKLVDQKDAVEKKHQCGVRKLTLPKHLELLGNDLKSFTHGLSSAAIIADEEEL